MIFAFKSGSIDFVTQRCLFPRRLLNNPRLDLWNVKSLDVFLKISLISSVCLIYLIVIKLCLNTKTSFTCLILRDF